MALLPEGHDVVCRMKVFIVGTNVLGSRADAHGVGLVIAVERTGGTRAMVVMETWALLEKRMSVWVAQVRFACTN